MSDQEKEELRKIAESIKIPAFHARADKSRDTYFGDSFSAIIARSVTDSLGSGLYVTSSLADVLEWMEHKLNSCNESCSIYLYDLGDASDLKELNSMDESSIYTKFLGALTKYVLRDLYFDHYTKKQPFTITDEKFNKICGQFCEMYNLSPQDVKDWADAKREECKELVHSDKLKKRKSIATVFQEDIMHVKGVDVSRSPDDDDASLGSLIFDVSSIKPVYEFGDNAEAAKFFYALVYDKIINHKLENVPLEDKETVKDIAFWGKTNFFIDQDLETYTEMILKRHEEICAQKDVVIPDDPDKLLKIMENNQRDIKNIADNERKEPEL